MVSGVVERRPVVYRLYQGVWSALDWLYPPRCGGCARPATRWCADCQDSVQRLTENICGVCGDLLPVAGICPACQEQRPAFVALRSWAVFNGPLRNALHRLKYKGDLALGEVLARPLIQIFATLAWEVDLMTAVPIGVDRLAQRGYNQASLLALPLALASGVAYQAHALAKVRQTRTQVGLNAAERQQNVAAAFQAERNLMGGHRVLVVDDVTTSGATMQACASALLRAGACQVYGLTLARAALSFA